MVFAADDHQLEALHIDGAAFDRIPSMRRNPSARSVSSNLSAELHPDSSSTTPRSSAAAAHSASSNHKNNNSYSIMSRTSSIARSLHDPMCEPNYSFIDGWDRLSRSIVTLAGEPVGTIAALDPSQEALNYNQVAECIDKLGAIINQLVDLKQMY
jgi:hypothetical protein